MADAVDLDALSDEEFLAALNSEDAEVELEDTDHTEAGSADVDEDADTNDQNDGGDQDTDESSTEEDADEDEENSQEEDFSDDEEGDELDDDSESDSESDESESLDDDEEEDDSDASTEDDSQTTSENDDGNKDSDEIDYRAEYEAILAEKEKLQSFYDEVTSEFIADGRKVKGFADPKKIIKSQQMSASYSNRMAALKPYRPLMKPLKERGYLDDPDKFNFDMQVADGDIEALKKLLKDKGIDPYELDMDNIDHKQKVYTASDIDIAVDDMFEDAKRVGVDRQLQDAFSRDWDDESIVEILSNVKFGADLLDHIESGAYDMVQDRIASIKRLDDGSFASMSKVDQYKAAVKSISEEQAKIAQQQQEMNAEPEAKEETQGESKADKEAEERAYKERVAKNKKASAARKKAASVSKVKSGRKKEKKTFDPDELSDEEFEAMIHGFMNE
jgi:hypothetical protein